MIWGCILGLCIIICYLWWQIYKLQVVLAGVIMKETFMAMKEVMEDLDFKGGYNDMP